MPLFSVSAPTVILPCNFDLHLRAVFLVEWRQGGATHVPSFEMISWDEVKDSLVVTAADGCSLCAHCSGGFCLLGLDLTLYAWGGSLA